MRDDVGDLLTPAERAAFETSPVFAPLRAAVNVRGWREVWAQRDITLSIDRGSLGGASLRNLMGKRSATLAFLHVHHEDLKHAIALAGANEHNAQETWHRVFRDAERAVRCKTETAFPELAQLPSKVREFVLWHRKGRLDALGPRWVPEQMTGLLGDQDGLYASTCNQYRASMNEVAGWAKAKGLMDHTGAECVPLDVSLLRAFMGGQTPRIRRLQRRDGYGESLDVGADPPPELQVSHAQIAGLLVASPIFAPLTDDERSDLAARVRSIALGPVERIIVQGRGGSSLFRAGRRRARGTATPARRDRSAGGHARPRRGLRRDVAADRRAAQQHRAHRRRGHRLEIGRDAFRRVVEARPAIVDDLVALMEQRLRTNERRAEAHVARQRVTHLSQRIRGFLFGRSARAATESLAD